MKRQIAALAIASALALVGCESSEPKVSENQRTTASVEIDRGEADTSGLEEAIDEANALDTTNCSNDTIQKLTFALNGANEVMKMKDPLQYRVDSAQRSLLSAIDTVNADPRMGSGESETTAEQDTTTTQPVEQVTVTTLTEGTYRVGTDIEAGEYKLTANSGTKGYWEVTGSSAPDAQIIGNDNFDGNAYVTVTDGQYLKLNRCSGVKVN